MSQLDRKMFRDLWRMKGQAAAICLVIASGIATFVMSMSTLESLQQTQKSYYEQSRFAHVFAHLKRAPDTLRNRIAEIPGVARLQTRVVADVTLDVAGLAEPAVGRLISIPESGASRLNMLHIRAGRNIEPGRRNEVLVNESFADAHGLRPGDSVAAVVNRRWQQLDIVGVLRRLERQPMKSLLSCFGISLAVAVLVLGSFLEDALMGLTLIASAVSALVVRRRIDRLDLVAVLKSRE